jgi:outer membrane lipoprotein LolB
MMASVHSLGFHRWARARLAAWGFCLLLVLLVTACQSNTRHRLRSAPATSAELRQRIQAGPWRLEGKMALSDGVESGSGRLQWQKDSGFNTVELTAPLGQGQWQLQETPQGAILRSSRRGVVTAASAAQLLEAEIGWAVPWAAMQHWLFGQAATDAPVWQSQQPGTTGAVRQLHENGWDIVYSRYKATKLGLLPHKIVARQGPYHVKVVIKHWHFPESATDPTKALNKSTASEPEARAGNQ